MVRLGVDTGGTFTDFVWLDENGRLQVHKQLSTPWDPSEAILAGISSLSIADDAEVVHGSTVATNALLERRGARTALITTAGFGDVLAIGRQNRTGLYALLPQKPEPLVPPEWRYELSERVTALGQVQAPLLQSEIEALVDRLAVDNIESVAVCLLFSFLWPDHEQQIRRAIDGHSGLPISVSLSSEILPEFREFERSSTTVINAYVSPLMGRYLTRLDTQIGRRRLAVMQSNGGIISASGAASQAARTVLSGPAGGVVGARYVAGVAGFDDLITFDMGGTSTDVALCPGHLPATTRGEIAGMPLRLPIIDIHTVGAGGGSLAYVDLEGALHVGPQSAGADPGPACYGRSDGQWRLEVHGQQIPYRVTTTDANLILGRLDETNFLGGTMTLDQSAAERQLRALARDLQIDSISKAAWQVIQVANATMERAIRRVSVERGFDPRLFTLVAFGGAGPLHACELAEQLQIPRVLVPVAPGVLSALGMLAAAPAKDYSRTIMRELETDLLLVDQFDEQFDLLVETATADMAREGHAADTLTFERALDMRYVGQSHELTVAYGSQEQAALFHAEHGRRFGYQRPDARVEVVNLRLKVTAAVRRLPVDAALATVDDGLPQPTGEKTVWFNGQPNRAGLYERQQLRAGQTVTGPAIVFQFDTTTVLPPGWRASVDRFGNLIVERAD